MFTAQFKFKVQSLKLKIVWLILSIVFTFYFLQFSFPKPSFAQTTPASTPSAYTAINPNQVPPQSPVYTNLMVYNLIHALSCLGIGQSIIGQPCVDYLAKIDPQGKVSTIPVLSSVNTSGGLLGATGSLLTGLFTNPPLRTADYLADVGRGFGIIPQAHAQVGGSGSGVLNPILKLWEVSRNLAYLFLIIIFIIIGLMVMFRQKINPQTVITAQAALPGLILGLILITFSYFFAALISDTAFLGTDLVGYYFVSAQPVSASGNPPLSQITATQSTLSIMSRFINGFDKGEFSGAVESILQALQGGPAEGFVKGAAALLAYQFGSFVGPTIGVVVGGGTCLLAPDPTFLSKLGVPLCALIGQTLGPLVIGGTAAGAVSLAPGPFIGVALWAIAISIIIYSMFRLLLKLINNFLTIIFLTVSAPFQFLAASLPGRQGIATAWFLNMLCNVLAFPAVMAIFYFIAYILGQGSAAGQPFIVNTPPTLAGSQTFPLLGGLNLSFIRLLLAFGALIATPSIPDIVCRAIGRVGQAGQLLGQEISGGVRSGQQQFAQGQQRLGGIGSNITSATRDFRGSFPKGLFERYTNARSEFMNRVGGTKKG